MGQSQELIEAFSYLRKYLPKQGPLEFFVHHNTFHELEDLNFKEALRVGQAKYSGKVLKSLSAYQQDFASGKIKRELLEEAIDGWLKQNEFHAQVKRDFVLDLLICSTADRGRDIVVEQIEQLSTCMQEYERFYDSALHELFQIEIDEIISPLILKFFSLYFDQGSAYWKMPDRDRGLLECFKYYFVSKPFFSVKWERSLSEHIRLFSDLNAECIIQEVLDGLGIKLEHTSDYLFQLSLRYKGWGGLILSLEKHPEWNKSKEIVSSFEEFVAVLAICEYAYLKSISKRKQLILARAIPVVQKTSLYSRGFLENTDALLQTFYQDANTELLVSVVSKLTDFERQFIWHTAYEETFYSEFLAAFSESQKHAKERSDIPSFQAMFCIDEREESIRRHLEVVDQCVETFGVAGHFGLDIRYKGIFNAHHRALCPDIVRPSKDVSEKLIDGQKARNTYSQWGKLLWIQSLGSKTLITGFVFQILTGCIAIVSLTITTLSPYLSFLLRQKAKKGLDQKIKTELQYEGSTQRQMSLDDMVAYAEGLLRTIGLVKRFSTVVFCIGHGSHSLNNPHEAAHDCGACGGGRGAPNARIISSIINREDVRTELRKRGIDIPNETVFVGGYHNTCSNEVLFFERPDRADVCSAIECIQRACVEDALERCRKFEDVSLSASKSAAYRHCLGRAYDYTQPRPEYGHATNALCVVGPRWRSRQLFLDRRSFLVSYESAFDSAGAPVLERILSAVGPVCSGINLEYYFSFMDNEVYGCGTKLPHNITSLLGVMNGYQSDLLLGLPWQMVEIHDPYRLMLVVVSELEDIKGLFLNLASFRTLVGNQWLHLAVYDPKSLKMYRYRNSEFQELDFTKSKPHVYGDHSEGYRYVRDASRLGIFGL